MRTVFWDYKTNEFKMIDQRQLPGTFEVLAYHDHKTVAQAITDMVVRGAPAIGAAAGFALALAGFESASTSTSGLLADLEAASATLKAARPTAVNLAWALDRIMGEVSPSPSGRGARGEGESRISSVKKSLKKPSASRMKMSRSTSAWRNTVQR